METENLLRFKPSVMTPEELETIFVQREELLRSILDRIGANALTPEKQNLLLVGPRGVGKTHLISLIYHRIKQVDELGDHLLTAWLRDEEWGVTCFRDLLLKILCAMLAQVYGNTAAEQRVAPIRALESKESELAAASLIKELVGDRTLLILAENFDDLIQKLGNIGGIQLFHFMQGNRFCCMIATSPSPITRVLLPGSPFHRGFFQIQQLQELSFNDAVQLIGKIARLQDNKELSSLVATPRGHARMRALRYLAGGNHRAYMIFAPLLTQESLGKLVKQLMQTIDELTPFYLSRLANLPPEQNRIIEYLSENRHPMQMADVAKACGIPPASALAQLESLSKMGHLQSFKIRDARYYEVRELLMRLAFEVKKHRNRPLGLLMDFLRLWYAPVELKEKPNALAAEGAFEQNHLPALQVLDQSEQDPAITEACREYNIAAQNKDFVQAVKAIEKLTARRSLNQDQLALASCLIRLGNMDEAMTICDRVVESNQADATVWQLRAWILRRIRRFNDALSSAQKSIELDPNDGRTWCDKAAILAGLNKPKEAMNCCEKAIGLNSKDPSAWEMRGVALAALRQYEDAVVAFTKAADLDPRNLSTRMHLCGALVELNRNEEALGYARQTIELNPDVNQALVLMGSVLASLKRSEEALQFFKKAISKGNDSSYVHYKVAELLLMMDHWREGMAFLDTTLSQFSHLENPDAGDTKALIHCLLPNLFAPRILQLSIKLLFLTYQKHRMLGTLGQGLIECIPEVTSSTDLSDAEVGLWRNSWQMIAGRFPEFRLPLRLLDSATRYRKTQDLRIFMDLPQEERKLLEQLTGVPIEAIG